MTNARLRDNIKWRARAYTFSEIVTDADYPAVCDPDGYWVQAYNGRCSTEVYDDTVCELVYNPVTGEHAYRSIQWQTFVRRNV